MSMLPHTLKPVRAKESTKKTNEMASMPYNVRRTPRISLDRPYNAHTWRIITTSAGMVIHLTRRQRKSLTVCSGGEYDNRPVGTPEAPRLERTTVHVVSDRRAHEGRCAMYFKNNKERRLSVVAKLVRKPCWHYIRVKITRHGLIEMPPPFELSPGTEWKQVLR